ncbi:hypothetical protein CHLRE_17g702550v5 [Chlamydomonas reinhardtii]|uniref:Transcription elongation factor 1 homolog n=1 Tax=Chlamydomonas reinhardtii TaxID=3055 RepID=A0A2K3CP32_CHLRE|nr:uncharacterized protein CHLRE_17g702550v5 [Chlamydomonas reinhardtii]PNW70023.1 hypothetical protein CHLRE_17g702550v5 [Chlamydomonas reinhardtii]
MGKRKGGSKPPPKKARAKLDTLFSCPFCNSSKSVSINFDRDMGRATAKCSQCSQKYESRCTPLTDAVDVYHDWLDSCEEANK